MMNTEEIALSASALRDFGLVKLPVSESCQILMGLQPKYARQWKEISNSTKTGNPLSENLKRHKLWPDSLVSAVRAGEIASQMPMVMDSLVRFVEDQKKIDGEVKKQIIEPLAYIGVGGLIFVGFMTFVFPQIAAQVEKKNRKDLIAVSDWFVNIYNNHLLEAGGLILLTLAAIVFILRQPATRAFAYKILDSIPGIGDGMRSIYMGFWARFISILARAGDIPYDEMVMIAAQFVPKLYHPSFQKFVKECNSSKGMQGAADISKMPKSDPRKRWPIRLAAGIQIGAQTGDHATTMNTISTALMEAGLKQVSGFLGKVRILGLIIAVISILTPMGGMMMTQVMISQSMK